MELAFCPASGGEIVFRPILVFTNEFNGAIAGFAHFLQALRKWQIAVNGPEHHRNGEGRAIRFRRCRRARFERGAWRGAGQCRTETSANKFESCSPAAAEAD